MFVFTMKASGLKFFGILALSIALLTTAIGILPSVNAAADVAMVTTDFKNISDEQDMVDFLSQFGHIVDPTPLEIFNIEIPETFNCVFESYNEIQRAQGLNLKRYLGKDATVYIFNVKNSEYEGDVLATLFVRNGRIIAGDICSKEGEGFIRGF